MTYFRPRGHDGVVRAQSLQRPRQQQMQSDSQSLQALPPSGTPTLVRKELRSVCMLLPIG